LNFKQICTSHLLR